MMKVLFAMVVLGMMVLGGNALVKASIEMDKVMFAPDYLTPNMCSFFHNHPDKMSAYLIKHPANRKYVYAGYANHSSKDR